MSSYLRELLDRMEEDRNVIKRYRERNLFAPLETGGDEGEDSPLNKLRNIGMKIWQDFTRDRQQKSVFEETIAPWMGEQVVPKLQWAASPLVPVESIPSVGKMSDQMQGDYQAYVNQGGQLEFEDWSVYQGGKYETPETMKARETAYNIFAPTPLDVAIVGAPFVKPAIKAGVKAVKEAAPAVGRTLAEAAAGEAGAIGKGAGKAKVPEVPVTPVGKEAWQMKLLEYGKSRLPTTQAAQITDARQVATFSGQHIREVKAAIERGDIVPTEVLQEYRGTAWADKALSEAPLPKVEPPQVPLSKAEGAVPIPLAKREVTPLQEHARKRVERLSSDPFIEKVQRERAQTLTDTSLTPEKRAEKLAVYDDLLKNRQRSIGYWKEKTAAPISEAVPPVKPPEIPAEGYFTPITKGKEGIAERQSAGLPAGKFYALDQPFVSEAHAAGASKKVAIPQVSNTFDPDGLLTGTDKAAHRKIGQEIVDELNKAGITTSKQARDAYTDGLTKRGFDSYIRGIDGDPANRELIVFNKPKAPISVSPKIPTAEAKPTVAPARAPETPSVPPPPKEPPTAVKTPPKDVVPTKPVVKPDGKLWLPEPPRKRAEYMPFAKQEMKGSFRKKQGAFETVEEAHQQVLKARDMGENVVPYVQTYVHQAGDLTKEFGLDAQGLVTKIGNPENRSLAINDVLSNYTHYKLTPAQMELARREGFVYQEALKLAKSYGVKINELPGTDDAWQYIARKVKGKLNPLTGEYDMPPTTVGGFKMGAKISAQKQRIFDEMFQGVDLGFLYEHPDQVRAYHVQGIYRLIGNKQAEDTVMGLTRQLTKQTPLKFGETVIQEPALKGRAAPTELANAIDKIYQTQYVPKGMRTAADVSGAMVGQVAALDVSAPFIQGLPILGHDIKQNLMGRPSAIWAQTYADMWKGVKNPERIAKYRIENHDLYKDAIEHGVAIGQSEFVSGVGTVQNILGKIPKAGSKLAEAYKQVWGRMGQAYSDFLEIARIRMYQQLAPVWRRQGRDLYELGAVINRMTGTSSAAARGVGGLRRTTERIAAFAPNYLRASILQVGDLIGTGAKAREVQSSLAALLGAGIAFYVAEEKLRGEEPKLKPWAKKFGGDGADAFTIGIGDTRVGVGSWLYGMIKTVADVGALAVDNPGAVVHWNEQHPIYRFAKSKQGPALSLAQDLVTGRNFFGQSFKAPSDYLMRIVESLAPIASQSMITQEPKGGLEQVAAEFAGLRAFPTPVKRVNQAVEEMKGKLGQVDTEALQKRIAGAQTSEMKAYIQERGDIVSTPDLATKLAGMTKYFTLKDMPEGKFEPIVYAYKRAEESFAMYEGVRPDKRDDFRRENPNIDAHLFFWGKVTTTKTGEAREIAENMIRQYGIPENAVPGMRKKAGGTSTPRIPSSFKMPTTRRRTTRSPFRSTGRRVIPNPFRR